MHMEGSDDPIGMLLAASMVRDEMPWFYEIILETYALLSQETPQKPNVKSSGCTGFGKH